MSLALAFLSLGYHPEPVGGAYRYARDLAERLAERGHRLRVIGPLPDARPLPNTTLHGVQLTRFPNANGFFASNWIRENRAAARLLDAWAQNAPEPRLAVLHQAYFRRALGPHPYAAVHYGPWDSEFLESTRSQGTHPLLRWLRRPVATLLRIEEAKALGRARAIFVLSRHSHSLLLAHHARPLPPIHILGGGVDLQRFAPAPRRAELRARQGLSPGDFLFLSVRRLDPRMGLDLLIQGFAQIAPSAPRAQLWIAGTGPEHDSLHHRIGSLGLESRVRLLGRVPEETLPELWNLADCAVLPSLGLEGFGLATAEALACGVPVLGTRSGATPELLEPLDPGLLFEPSSLDAVRHALARALDQPSRLPGRDRCRGYAESRFDWSPVVDRFERATDSLVRSNTEVATR